MADTLYDKYGGFKTVSRVVMTFYELALESDQIGDYFENIDMARLMDHQTKFVSSLLGGPASFGDDRLKHVHSHLGIGDVDFDEVVDLLAEALDEHGIQQADIHLVRQAIEGKRHLVVAEKAA